MFAIELKSKECLKRVSIPSDEEDDVSIEGFLGEVETVDIIEDAMLEIKGTNGILRMDLRGEELRSCFRNRSIGRTCRLRTLESTVQLT